MYENGKYENGKYENGKYENGNTKVLKYVNVQIWIMTQILIYCIMVCAKYDHY